MSEKREASDLDIIQQFELYELYEKDRENCPLRRIDIESGKLDSSDQPLSPEEQVALLIEMLDWELPRFGPEKHLLYFCLLCKRNKVIEFMSKGLPLSERHLTILLEWLIEKHGETFFSEKGIIQTIEAFSADHSLSPSIRLILDQHLRRYTCTAEEDRTWIVSKEIIERYRVLLNENMGLPLDLGEPWTFAVIEALKALTAGEKGGEGEEQFRLWSELFTLCAQATTAKPSERWLKAAAQQLDLVGRSVFIQAILAWLPLVTKPRVWPLPLDMKHPSFDPNPDLLTARNEDLLRGLVWMCSLIEDPDVARVVAHLAIAVYRKVRHFGARSVKVGKACIWVLQQMPSELSISQLSLLKHRINAPSVQKLLETALRKVAGRTNISDSELEELSVQSYGLESVGVRCETFGDYIAELKISDNGINKVEIQWLKPDGKRQAAVPKAVKENHAQALKQLTQAKKDIEQALPVQASRIERLYLENRRWNLLIWRQCYLDHPLLGTLARRLIWAFKRGDQETSAIWWEGKLVNQNGQTIDWLDDETTVALWHPIFAPVEVQLDWREWIEAHKVRQPFKQAHREIYELTDAERQTQSYSNRFAGHFLRLYQFKALCARRGWKDQREPYRLLPGWNLHAELWVYDTDRLPDGETVLTTDQVRFYRVNQPTNDSPGSQAGNRVSRRQRAMELLPLENVPQLVFSEIMRDVDLFVGVASVGNDPTWLDGGREQRYVDYWSEYSFGSLPESARTRKQVLEKLIPHLKIAPRCSFNDRFLVVSGDLRTYKIHLGSGNILMEPNDQYLCIVPARGTSSSPNEKIFLPFEGDSTLSVILSKAFLLADDRKINDPTILRQLKS